MASNKSPDELSTEVLAQMQQEDDTNLKWIYEKTETLSESDFVLAPFEVTTDRSDSSSSSYTDPLKNTHYPKFRFFAFKSANPILSPYSYDSSTDSRTTSPPPLTDDSSESGVAISTLPSPITSFAYWKEIGRKFSKAKRTISSKNSVPSDKEKFRPAEELQSPNASEIPQTKPVKRSELIYPVITVTQIEALLTEDNMEGILEICLEEYPNLDRQEERRSQLKERIINKSPQDVFNEINIWEAALLKEKTEQQRAELHEKEQAKLIEEAQSKTDFRRHTEKKSQTQFANMLRRAVAISRITKAKDKKQILQIANAITPEESQINKDLKKQGLSKKEVGYFGSPEELPDDENPGISAKGVITDYFREAEVSRRYLPLRVINDFSEEEERAKAVEANRVARVKTIEKENASSLEHEIKRDANGIAWGTPFNDLSIELFSKEMLQYLHSINSLTELKEYEVAFKLVCDDIESRQKSWRIENIDHSSLGKINKSFSIIQSYVNHVIKSKEQELNISSEKKEEELRQDHKPTSRLRRFLFGHKKTANLSEDSPESFWLNQFGGRTVAETLDRYNCHINNIRPPEEIVYSLDTHPNLQGMPGENVMGLLSKAKKELGEDAQFKFSLQHIGTTLKNPFSGKCLQLIKNTKEKLTGALIKIEGKHKTPIIGYMDEIQLGKTASMAEETRYRISPNKKGEANISSMTENDHARLQKKRHI